MNILVCNDTRSYSIIDKVKAKGMTIERLKEADRQEIREKANRDFELIKMLRKRGHKVVLFDGFGYDMVSEITKYRDASEAIGEIFAKEEITGLVYDLQYHGDFKYGIEVLKNCFREQLFPVELFLVVYSRFVNERSFNYVRELNRLFLIPKERCVDRFSNSIDVIADMFEDR